MSRTANLAPLSWARLFLVVLLLAVLILRLAFGRAPDGSLLRVQDARVLIVALDASYPPFETTDGMGKFSGFDVDVAREIAARLGVDVQFANIAFDSLYDALAGRRADVVISGLRYEAERTRDVIYTPSYFDAGQTLIVRAADAAQKPADLAGQTVAVERASEADVAAHKLAARVAGLRVHGYETSEAALRALNDGAEDALATDHVSALAMVKGQAGLRLLLPPFAPDPLVIAGHAEDRTLMTEINRIVKVMHDDGALARLVAQSF